VSGCEFVLNLNLGLTPFIVIHEVLPKALNQSLKDSVTTSAGYCYIPNRTGADWWVAWLESWLGPEVDGYFWNRYDTNVRHLRNLAFIKRNLVSENNVLYAIYAVVIHPIIRYTLCQKNFPSYQYLLKYTWNVFRPSYSVEIRVATFE
jgi:hypothetical protein